MCVSVSDLKDLDCAVILVFPRRFLCGGFVEQLQFLSFTLRKLFDHPMRLCSYCRLPLPLHRLSLPMLPLKYEPDERPTAEDTLLWLEDLCDALPDDLEPPRTPIDYESLFPLEMGEREIDVWINDLFLYFFCYCPFWFRVLHVWFPKDSTLFHDGTGSTYVLYCEHDTRLPFKLRDHSTPPSPPLPSSCPGNPQRRGSSAKNLAKTKSTAVVKFSATPGGVTPAGMTVGPGNDESMFNNITPMSPVILSSGRRATVGPAGAGIASKFKERSGGEPLGMKKAKSMQVRSLR